MLKRILSLSVIVCFFLTTLTPFPQAHADTLNLPAPGTMVNLSPAYQPVIIKGLTVHKDNPFLFDFIVDVGQDRMSGEPLKKEGLKLIKYFLAGLAIPDKDVWVNLSPYEKSKIIPEALSQTDMGRDLLEQDYILKQITASLIYPEKQLGKTFWDKVYSKAQQMYGTTQVPVNTFNKVWIMADKAEVFEHNQTAFVVDCHLKVMLEEDYLALFRHSEGARSATEESQQNLSFPNVSVGNPDKAHSIASNIVRQIILPQLEKEVNTGKNFANLRQIFNSIILSSWYKKTLKQALLNQVYANKSKVKGIQRPQNLSFPNVSVGNPGHVISKDDVELIYEQYLKAYKKGVFNYIKEDVNNAGETMPRKYFSGGILAEGAASEAMLTVVTDPLIGTGDMAQQSFNGEVDLTVLTSLQKPNLASAAMITGLSRTTVEKLNRTNVGKFMIQRYQENGGKSVIKENTDGSYTLDGIVTHNPEDHSWKIAYSLENTNGKNTNVRLSWNGRGLLDGSYTTPWGKTITYKVRLSLDPFVELIQFKPSLNNPIPTNRHYGFPAQIIENLLENKKMNALDLAQLTANPSTSNPAMTTEDLRNSFIDEFIGKLQSPQAQKEPQPWLVFTSPRDAQVKWGILFQLQNEGLIFPKKFKGNLISWRVKEAITGAPKVIQRLQKMRNEAMITREQELAKAQSSVVDRAEVAVAPEFRQNFPELLKRRALGPQGQFYDPIHGVSLMNQVLQLGTQASLNDRRLLIESDTSWQQKYANPDLHQKFPDADGNVASLYDIVYGMFANLWDITDPRRWRLNEFVPVPAPLDPTENPRLQVTGPSDPLSMAINQFNLNGSLNQNGTIERLKVDKVTWAALRLAGYINARGYVYPDKFRGLNGDFNNLNLSKEFDSRKEELYKKLELAYYSRLAMRMPDLEDASAGRILGPQPNAYQGIINERLLAMRKAGAFKVEAKEGKIYNLHPSRETGPASIQRINGSGILDEFFTFQGKPIPAYAVDLILHFFATYGVFKKNGDGNWYYVPKVQTPAEALLIERALRLLEGMAGLKLGTIKIELLYEEGNAGRYLPVIMWIFRHRLVGPNIGRWDHNSSQMEMRVGQDHFPDPQKVDMFTPQAIAYQVTAKRMTLMAGGKAIGGMNAAILYREGDRYKRDLTNPKALRGMFLDKLRERIIGLTFVTRDDVPEGKLTLRQILGELKSGQLTGKMDDSQYRQSWVAHVDELYVMAGNIPLLASMEELQTLIKRSVQTVDVNGQQVPSLGSGLTQDEIQLFRRGPVKLLSENGDILPDVLAQPSFNKPEHLINEENWHALNDTPEGDVTPEGIQNSIYMDGQYDFQIANGNLAAAIYDYDSGVNGMNDLATERGHTIYPWSLIHYKGRPGGTLTTKAGYIRYPNRDLQFIQEHGVVPYRTDESVFFPAGTPASVVVAEAIKAHQAWVDEFFADLKRLNQPSRFDTTWAPIVMKALKMRMESPYYYQHPARLWLALQHVPSDIHDQVLEAVFKESREEVAKKVADGVYVPKILQIRDYLADYYPEAAAAFAKQNVERNEIKRIIDDPYGASVEQKIRLSNYLGVSEKNKQFVNLWNQWLLRRNEAKLYYLPSLTLFIEEFLALKSDAAMRTRAVIEKEMASVNEQILQIGAASATHGIPNSSQNPLLKVLLDRLAELRAELQQIPADAAMVTVFSYTIQEGEKAEDIAKRFGITPEQLAEDNPDKTFQAGQKIIIKTDTPQFTYPVQDIKDTLFTVSRKVGMEKDIAKLAELNGLTGLRTDEPLLPHVKQLRIVRVSDAAMTGTLENRVASYVLSRTRSFTAFDMARNMGINISDPDFTRAVNILHIWKDEGIVSSTGNDNLRRWNAGNRAKLKELAKPAETQQGPSEDQAMAHATIKPQVEGGIDLNTSNGMQWKVSKDGNGVEMTVDPAMIERIRHMGIDWLSPEILKMTPITSIWPLVGIQAPAQAEHLAKL